MKCKCLRPTCGHEWIARVKKPKACPSCKNYQWDKPSKYTKHEGHPDSESITAEALAISAKILDKKGTN